jgi:hypothetical protein
MGIDPVTLALVAVGTSVGSSIAQQNQAKKASAAQREGQIKMLAEERKRAEVDNVRKLRQQIREQRIAQGALTSQAALTGGVGGSAFAGASSSAASQTASNVSFMQDIAEINTNIDEIQMETAQRVGSAQSKAATYGAIGDISGTIFKDMGGWKKVFGANAPKKP